VGSLEVASLEVGSLEIGSCKVGSSEVGSSEAGFLEVGSSEVGMLEVGSSEVGYLEVGFMKIEASMVFLRCASLRASQHIQDCLDVSSGAYPLRTSRLLRPFIRCRRRTKPPPKRMKGRRLVRGPFGGPKSLSSVLPNVSC